MQNTGADLCLSFVGAENPAPRTLFFIRISLVRVARTNHESAITNHWPALQQTPPIASAPQHKKGSCPAAAPARSSTPQTQKERVSLFNFFNVFVWPTAGR